jgi:hypothetical protein
MAVNRIERVVKHTRPCRTDADCVRVDTSTNCQGTCGMWVHRRFAERVQSFVEHVDQRYCTAFQAAGCSAAMPRCRGEVGECVHGECTGQALTSVEKRRERPNRIER